MADSTLKVLTDFVVRANELLDDVRIDLSAMIDNDGLVVTLRWSRNNTDFAAQCMLPTRALSNAQDLELMSCLETLLRSSGMNLPKEPPKAVTRDSRSQGLSMDDERALLRAYELVCKRDAKTVTLSGDTYYRVYRLLYPNGDLWA